MNEPEELMRIPASLLQRAMELAKEQGVSLNEWITNAVEEKVESMRHLERA